MCENAVGKLAQVSRVNRKVTDERARRRQEADVYSWEGELARSFGQTTG